MAKLASENAPSLSSVLVEFQLGQWYVITKCFVPWRYRNTHLAAPQWFLEGFCKNCERTETAKEYLVWFSSPTTSRIQPVVDNLNGVSHQQALGSVPSIGCALMLLVCC